MDLLTEWATTWVPTWVMALVVSLLTISLFIGVPLARVAGRRRGERLANPEAYATLGERTKDTAIFLAALIPSVLVWLSVMTVSFIGLTGFAEDVMEWHHWTNVLVPLSLDGISISFGAWAFVSVKRGRHPGRAYNIVFAAAAMSAVLNFVHGREEWSIWAGLYLAFLSMAGMAMFHELLDQFMASYDDEIQMRARYPRFGQRWVYAPWSTFMARRAWIVYPPDDGMRATVRNALDHLELVREAKRLRKLDASMRVREEQQAKLVEVQAKAEVRHAKSSSRRRVDSVPHRHIVPPQPHYDPPFPPSPPSQPQVPQQVPAPRPLSDAVPVLDADSRAQIESVLTSSNGRDVLGRRPLGEQRTGEPAEPQANGGRANGGANGGANGRDVLGKRAPLSDQRREETQRMIAEAMAMGEDVQPEAVMDWVQRHFGGSRPTYSWARDQILTVRSRDAVGLDADLV